MPVRHFDNESVLFTITLNKTWRVLGAAGSFCLPYFRRRYETERELSFDTVFIAVPPLDDPPALYIWEGQVYIEYDSEDNLYDSSSRLEFAGAFRPAGHHEVARYLLPTETDIGPVAPNALDGPYA